MDTQIDTTVFKTFANISDLLAKTANKAIYIELSNGYFIRVTKADIKKVAATMNKNNDKFCGSITVGDSFYVQIKLS